LVLLSETLVRPASVYAEADAQLIHNFVQFLEQFQKAGCDVQRLLEGCRRLCNLASSAVIAAQSGEQIMMFGQSLEVSQKAINSRGWQSANVKGNLVNKAQAYSNCRLVADRARTVEQYAILA
jgi:hypothetical protein